MILIKIAIQNNKSTKVKQVQFCKRHERNLRIMYEIARESINQNQHMTTEQFVIISCFYIVKHIRKNRIIEVIRSKLLSEYARNQNIVKLLKFNSIYIEARIDNISKKIIEFPRAEFATSQLEQQVLR